MLVLLVYNMIPENMKIYNLIVSPEELEMLKQCHGKFCNGSEVEESHPLNRLSEWLTDKEDRVVYADDKDEETPPLMIPKGSILIVSGFIL